METVCEKAIVLKFDMEIVKQYQNTIISVKRLFLDKNCLIGSLMKIFFNFYILSWIQVISASNQESRHKSSSIFLYSSYYNKSIIFPMLLYNKMFFFVVGWEAGDNGSTRLPRPYRLLSTSEVPYQGPHDPVPSRSTAGLSLAHPRPLLSSQLWSPSHLRLQPDLPPRVYQQ